MIYIIIAAVIAVTDIIIKKYINKTFDMSDERVIFNGKLKLSKHHNHGAAMNYLEGRKKIILFLSSAVFSIICIIFVSIIPKRGNDIKKLAYSFMAGGGASNLYDRISKGYVTDYFSFLGDVPKKLKRVVFNIADIFIFLGAAIMLLREIPAKN